VAVEAGTRFGPYEIVSRLGAGGMGEVYRARDTRLGREVAVKVIDPGAAADAVWRARFEREARVISALQHPNICPLFDEFLVMQLLEGHTLAERLERGPLSTADAIEVAAQIADALDHAHRRGIVHRDVKPGNVMLTTSSGAPRAVLLDFGLARALTDLPTSSTHVSLTTAGLTVGTIQYMAPEQVEGRDADARADIFALGAVLFEMLTGRRAFEGSSYAAIAGAIVATTPPPVSSLVSSISPSIDRIVAKCLAKDPADRWQSAADLAEALRLFRDGSSPARVVPARDRPAARRRIAPLAAAALIGAAIAAFAVYAWRAGVSRPPGSPPVRFTIELPGATIFQPAVSPDGSRVAFVAPDASRRPVIWVRALGDEAPRAVPGTEGGGAPFWAPDGSSLGFFANGRLWRVSLRGEAPRFLAEAPGPPLGAAWSPEGVIVYSLRFQLIRIDTSGQAPFTIASIDRAWQENSIRWPTLLPGRRVLYVARSGRPEKSALYLASLDGGPPKRLFSTLSKVVYSPTGHLLYVRNGSLLAQPFDLAGGAVRGEPIVVQNGVGADTIGLGADFSVSDTGVLAFTHGTERQQGPVRWFGRDGQPLALLGTGSYATLRLSPDDRRVAADTADLPRGSRHIVILDAASGGATPLTYLNSHDWEPVWSPDGSRIAFSSFREGPGDLYMKAADGAASETVLLADNRQKDVRDWSPDGRLLAFSASEGSRLKVYLLPLQGPDREPFSIAPSDGDQTYPSFSPDGRWIAYSSNESGTGEIYVQPMPPTGARWQVSAGGGIVPRWRQQHELFYATAQGDIVAVPVDTSSGALRASPPRVLFQAPGMPVGGGGVGFDVTRDGRRFLVHVRPRPASGLVVVAGWPSLLGASQENVP
jgi:eukaryotic-like serine/threonine-protein kinase